MGDRSGRGTVCIFARAFLAAATFGRHLRMVNSKTGLTLNNMDTAKVRYGYDHIVTEVIEKRTATEGFAFTISGDTAHLCAIRIIESTRISKPAFIRGSISKIPRWILRADRFKRDIALIEGLMHVGIPWKSWQRMGGQLLLDAAMEAAKIPHHARLEMVESLVSTAKGETAAAIGIGPSL